MISNIHRLGCLNKFIANFNIDNNDFAKRRKLNQMNIIISTTYIDLAIWFNLTKRKKDKQINIKSK